MIVGAVAAGDDFAVSVLRWHPCFDVIFLGCDCADVTCADVDDAIGQFEFLDELFGVLDEFFVELPGLFGCAEDELFDFVELVCAEYASCVFAVCSCFFAEASADSSEFKGQLLFGEDFVLEHGCHGVFAGCDEVEVFVFDFVEYVFEVA